MFDYLKKIIEHVRQISRSIDDYKKLSPSGAMPAVAQVNKALKLLKAKKIDEAETILLEADELYPENEAVLRTLGYLFETRKNFEQAAKYFQKALNHNPIKKDLFMRLGYAQLSARQNEGALKTFKNAKKVFPLDSEVITGHGMALYRLEKYDEARSEFIKAFAIDARNLNALFLSATIDIMFNDLERAETRLSLLVKLAPNTAHLYEYAKLKKLKGDYDSALTLATRALDTNKNFLPVYILLAEIHNCRFEVKEALEWLQKAEDAELFDASLYMARANICMFKPDFETALTAYRKVLEFEQDKSTDMKILICEILLDRLEDKEQTVSAMLDGIEDDECEERKAVAYMLAGVWQFKTGSLKNAEDFFKKALQITLKLPVVYYLLARIYQAQGEDYKTEKYYTLEIEKNPYHFDAHRDFIEYLMGKENFEEARFKIKKALKLFPDCIELENLLFYAGFQLLNDKSAEYNVKELLKLAEKLEEKASFLYADEKNILLEKIRGLE